MPAGSYVFLRNAKYVIFAYNLLGLWLPWRCFRNLIIFYISLCYVSPITLFFKCYHKCYHHYYQRSF